MEIGDTYVLTDNAFPEKGDAINFVEVTIVESRPVRGMWGNDTYTGFRATDKQDNEYFSNWNSFPDDSMTPTWMWQGKSADGNFCFWYNPCKDHTLRFPVELAEQLATTYPNSIGFCKLHETLFEKFDDFGCFDCYLEKPPLEKPKLKTTFN